jgi:hypothetical protein
MADYRVLYDILVEESKKDSDAIPHWARSAFHDLANFDPATGQGGPHGCMRDDPVRSMAQNSQLDGVIRRLNRLVLEKLPSIAFPFGDVISMAGKVAIERAYPGIRIKWRPGRPACGFETEGAPGASIQTQKEMDPFLKRYGFSPREFAILLAGTHGLKDAVVHVNNGERPWIHSRSSGREFVLASLNQLWWFNDKFKFDTAGITHLYTAGSIVRLPVDMLFFPTSVNKAVGKPKWAISEPAYLPVEQSLRELVKGNETVFNNEFAIIYSKMLEIGVKAEDMKDWYVDTPEPHEH